MCKRVKLVFHPSMVLFLTFYTSQIRASVPTSNLETMRTMSSKQLMLIHVRLIFKAQETDITETLLQLRGKKFLKKESKSSKCLKINGK